MDIKKNSANIVSIVRVFVAFAAIGLLYFKTTNAYILSFLLTILAFWMDGIDGFLARKYGQSSPLGAVIDILCDRIVEASYWIAFAVFGWLPLIFPIICVARAFTTDGIRSVALSQGMTAFGESSMQSTAWGKFICSSRIMRGSYAVAKAAAFILLIVAYTPCDKFNLMKVEPVAVVLAWIAIIFCVVRAIPVVAESGKLFK